MQFDPSYATESHCMAAARTQVDSQEVDLEMDWLHNGFAFCACAFTFALAVLVCACAFWFALARFAFAFAFAIAVTLSATVSWH